jgi:endonuclease III
LIPRPQWVDFSHRVIHHGRSLCAARKPKCPACPFQTICPKVGVE